MIREEINLDWVKQLNIAIRYIEEHLTGTIEYEELAKMLCCSTYQFQRMFAFTKTAPINFETLCPDVRTGQRAALMRCRLFAFPHRTTGRRLSI